MFVRGERGNILRVACIYITTVIGAGFASGQEIVQFFSNYYKGGFYGIILAGLLFALIGYVVLDKVYAERIRSYEELLFPSLGWFVGWVVEIAVSLFMLSVFCIMIAGTASVMAEKVGIPYIYGGAIAALLCMISILFDIKGIMNISTVITPILIIGILFVGIFTIAFNDTSVFSPYEYFTKITDNWFFSALLYVGYNSIIAIVVMCSLLPHLKTRKIGRVGGILGGLILCFIALVLNTTLFFSDALSKELPVLSITEKHGSILNSFYAVVLFLAMYTSAITSGFGFIERVSTKLRVNKKIIVILICALAVPLSNFGFSNLIATVYPFFGYIGLFVVLVILFQNIRFKKSYKIKKYPRG